MNRRAWGFGAGLSFWFVFFVVMAYWVGRIDGRHAGWMQGFNDYKTVICEKFHRRPAR